MKALLSIFTILFLAVPAHARTVLLTTTNTVKLEGVINGYNIHKTSLALSKMVQNRRTCQAPIYLVINSPGGSIAAGNKFIRFAKSICNLHTVTLDGASMASAIVEQLPGKRLATDTSTLMFHRASVGIQGQVETGEVETRLAMVKAVVKQMEVLNAKRIGITLADYKSKVVNEWWMYGKQALKQGAIDEIVELKCSKKLQAQTTSKTVRTIFGTRNIEVSACPLM